MNQVYRFVTLPLHYVGYWCYTIDYLWRHKTIKLNGIQVFKKPKSIFELTKIPNIEDYLTESEIDMASDFLNLKKIDSSNINCYPLIFSKLFFALGKCNACPCNLLCVLKKISKSLQISDSFKNNQRIMLKFDKEEFTMLEYFADKFDPKLLDISMKFITSNNKSISIPILIKILLKIFNTVNNDTTENNLKCFDIITKKIFAIVPLKYQYSNNNCNNQQKTQTEIISENATDTIINTLIQQGKYSLLCQFVSNMFYSLSYQNNIYIIVPSNLINFFDLLTKLVDVKCKMIIKELCEHNNGLIIGQLLLHSKHDKLLLLLLNVCINKVENEERKSEVVNKLLYLAILLKRELLIHEILQIKGLKNLINKDDKYDLLLASFRADNYDFLITLIVDNSINVENFLKYISSNVNMFLQYPKLTEIFKILCTSASIKTTSSLAIIRQLITSKSLRSPNIYIRVNYNSQDTKNLEKFDYFFNALKCSWLQNNDSFYNLLSNLRITLNDRNEGEGPLRYMINEFNECLSQNSLLVSLFEDSDMMYIPHYDNKEWSEQTNNYLNLGIYLAIAFIYAPIKLNISSSIFKYIANQSEEIELHDFLPEYFNNMLIVMDTWSPKEFQAANITMTITNKDSKGNSKTYNLCENGENIEITYENYSEYKDYLRIFYEFSGNRHIALETIKEGFYKVIKSVFNMNWDILENIIVVKQTRESKYEWIKWVQIEFSKSYSLGFYRLTKEEDMIKKLINETNFKLSINKPTEIPKEIIWFFKIIDELTDDEYSKLVRFINGNNTLPCGGLKHLSSTGNNIRLCFNSNNKRVPTSSTCSRRINLTQYDNYDNFEKFLKLAIECNSLDFV
jgi:hypothetical protein